jgi:DNA polymerase-4
MSASGQAPVYRRVIHIDMDAFYASVEQRDNPGSVVFRSLSGDRESVASWRPRSCWGSPSRTIVRAACETARTFANDICAASSMNSTSTVVAASGRAQNQAVAAAGCPL